MGRRILITGKLSAGLLMALALEGLELEQAGWKFTVRPQGIPNDWRMLNTACALPQTHGPQRKGKGGKVKRW
jgi:hypothetical protein